MKYLQSNLKFLREREGFTQAEVENKLNLGSRLVCHWEVGRSFPSVPDLLKVSKLYAVSIHDLVRSNLQKSSQEIIFKNFLIINHNLSL